MENCRNCGIEIEPDITNPLNLCEDCGEVPEDLCAECDEELRMCNYENADKEVCSGMICINPDCSLYVKPGYGL